MEKFNFKIKMLSSLVHTEETSSNIANIYRETILKNGKIEKIPALHGNSLRGLLRNIGAVHLFNFLELKEEVPQSIFYFLTSGGYLDSVTVGVDIMARRNIRRLCPLLSIFGSAFGNDMIQGKMVTPSLLPKCKELSTGEESYWDMTSIIRYTRQDDKKSIMGDNFVKVADKTENPMQMFYDIEVLNAGVELEGTLYFDYFTSLEKSCFYTILEKLQDKPFIGGKSSVGHGKFEFIFDKEIDFEKETAEYKEFLENHKDEIKDFILSFK